MAALPLGVPGAITTTMVAWTCLYPTAATFRYKRTSFITTWVTAPLRRSLPAALSMTLAISSVVFGATTTTTVSWTCSSAVNWGRTMFYTTTMVTALSLVSRREAWSTTREIRSVAPGAITITTVSWICLLLMAPSQMLA